MQFHPKAHPQPPRDYIIPGENVNNIELVILLFLFSIRSLSKFIKHIKTKYSDNFLYINIKSKKKKYWKIRFPHWNHYELEALSGCKF